MRSRGSCCSPWWGRCALALAACGSSEGKSSATGNGASVVTPVGYQSPTTESLTR